MNPDNLDHEIEQGLTRAERMLKRQRIIRFAIVGLVMLCLVGAGAAWVGGGALLRFLQIPPAVAQPTSTAVKVRVTNSATQTAMPTETPTPTHIPSPMATQTPAFGIGSRMTSPVDGMMMVYVPEGEFTKGSNDSDNDEKSIYKVFLDAYWIDQTEVTNGMYALCVQAGKCEYSTLHLFVPEGRYSNHRNPGFDDYPVILVSWFDAENYCEWAGRRLPTEAEWEKAARGTNALTYPWGEQSPNCELANFDPSRGVTCFSDTRPVGYFPNSTSPYGALDMAGNVWEWVADLDPSYYQNSALGLPTSVYMGESQGRVARGGSWWDQEDFLRTSSRREYPPSAFDYNLGFRCAYSN